MPGFSDVLPDAARDLRWLEENIRDIFEKWGYSEIRTPSLEYVDFLQARVGSELADRMFKFQDADGKMVALRPEVTATVARLISSDVGLKPPVRLCYLGQVFRREQRGLKGNREVSQAGAELIGVPEPHGDVEILAMLISMLRHVGLKGYRIDVGHATLLRRLGAIAGLDDETARKLRERLGYRDWSGIESILTVTAEGDALLELLRQLDRVKHLSDIAQCVVAENIRKHVWPFIANLSEVGRTLRDLSMDENVHFDFTLTREMEYYTGIMFEVTSQSSSLKLGGGGRYDDLLERFGETKVPATGFAVTSTDLLADLKAAGVKVLKPDVGTAIVLSPNFIEALKVSEMLRAARIPAIADVQAENAQERHRNFRYVISIAGEEATVVDMLKGSKRRIAVDRLAQELGRPVN